MASTYITVAIPYVNAAPHLGHAYELVVGDVVARACRAGGDVRFQGGTDENSLKNVLAADESGVDAAAFVAENAGRFRTLADQLGVEFDDFIRTSSDPRHRPAVERLWTSIRAAGDLYLSSYRGRYCVGCEEFKRPDDLDGDRCPEHAQPLDVVDEHNWFFRLSRHGLALEELIETDRLRIRPEPFRREVLSFVRDGLDDISVSRPSARARGWGVPVPGDPSQVVYVWFDALVNYISTLGLGGVDEAALARWWADDVEKVHVIGKGVLRFHAVFWPAFLLSAGLPLPDRIEVHPYLTLGGRKLSKSAGAGLSPRDALDAVGCDGLRWWFAREVSATVDTDVTLDRLVEAVDRDLANTIGNALHRVATLCARHGAVDALPTPADGRLGTAVAAALARHDLRGATQLIVDAASAVNRELEAEAPWAWVADPSRSSELASLLARLAGQVTEIGWALDPVAPALGPAVRDTVGRSLQGVVPTPVFPRRKSSVGGRPS